MRDRICFYGIASLWMLFFLGCCVELPEATLTVFLVEKIISATGLAGTTLLARSSGLFTPRSGDKE